MKGKKMKKYKIFAILLSFILIIPTLFSCQRKSEGELYFLNFKPEIASVYNEIAKAYKEETGIDLRVVTAASGTYEQTLKSEIGKKDAPLIFVVNGPRGFASWRDYCADLSGIEIRSRLVLSPSTALIESITIDLPAPVSPVRTLRPSPKRISACSITAMFSILRLVSIAKTPFF